MSKTIGSTTRTIRISNEIYEDLAKRGKFGESFNSVLVRVLKEKDRLEIKI